jgi:hypothetical protein
LFVKLRAVSSGWVRAAFFAVLAALVFLLFHTVMARSRLAFAGFTWTFLGIPALSLLEELRRRPPGHTPRYEPAPDDAAYESRTSLGPLAWPVALLLWFFVPAAIVGSAVNFAIGLAVHNVAGAMGAMAAVAAGLLGGLGAWMGLRTLSVWLLGAGHSRWPLWMAVPRPSVSFRALRAEWPRDGVFYYRPEGYPR